MAEYSLDSPADQMETIPSCLHQRLGCVASGGETDQTMPQASVTHTPMLQKRGRDDMLNNTLTPVTPSSRKRTRFSDPPSGRENSPSGHEFRLSCPYQKAYPSSGLHCTGWAGGFENPNRLRYVFRSQRASEILFRIMNSPELVLISKMSTARLIVVRHVGRNSSHNMLCSNTRVTDGANPSSLHINVG